MIAVAGPPPLLNTNGARSRPNSEVDRATDRGEAPKDFFFLLLLIVPSNWFRLFTIANY